MKSTILDIVGVVAITAGCAMIAIWLGLMVLGIACLTVSYLSPQGNRVHDG